MSNMTKTRIGKCPNGHIFQMTTEWLGAYSPCLECEPQIVVHYGREQEWRPPVKWANVRATVKPETTCDGDCHTAKGEKCICSCGGKNHGIAWAA